VGRTHTLEEIGNRGFVASDKAGPMTAATVSVSARALAQANGPPDDDP
jgi:hypothetical protein